ncbi:uncharacterized protein LOC112041745 [Lingula anatina]|uniref:Uncharacterized protein LOC112041745 n=1 Tax=Lingula anatina TaxID=7574 RepID=A0A2R2MLL1_LINAN|nr:uncharacterized protein LOC112041745 [Lingula anatina]|eukprot:XP_023931106.1 uncharacterized protein LOC112041745 [Lingula anatina]
MNNDSPTFSDPSNEQHTSDQQSVSSTSSKRGKRYRKRRPKRQPGRCTRQTATTPTGHLPCRPCRHQSRISSVLETHCQRNDKSTLSLSQLLKVYLSSRYNMGNSANKEALLQEDRTPYKNLDDESKEDKKRISSTKHKSMEMELLGNGST